MKNSALSMGRLKTIDPEIEYIVSENYSDRQGHKADIICCHQTNAGIENCIDRFKDPESKHSAHFAVSKEGEVYQFVDIEKRALSNCIDYIDPKKRNHYSRSLNPIIRSRKTDASFYTVSIEFENNRSGVLSFAQYHTGLNLMRYIISEMKRLYDVDFIVDRDHFIGHYEVCPVTAANCPGIDFPFNCFIKDLKGEEI